MGLSSFNRMRREKSKVAEMEAERFKADNEARQARTLDRVAVHDANLDKVEDVRKEELAAAERIGAKVEEGMKSGVLDEPLRKDHAAEIAGRNLDGAQEPRDPVKAVSERIPSGTANEVLVPLTTAESEGPSEDQLTAARVEAGVLPDPATGEENVAPKGETAPKADSVDIPPNWEGSHWQTRVALARRISGRDDVKTDEANEIIAAEVERRG